MTNYYPEVARAVCGARSADERRVVYERAWRAVMTQLRDARPALGELQILIELESLDEAIRKTEAAVRRTCKPRITALREVETGYPGNTELSPEPRYHTLPPSRSSSHHFAPGNNWRKIGLILIIGAVLTVAAVVIKMHLKA